MSPRVSRVPPALKHGAYAATGILPGESRAEFDKLHRGLIAELNPSGPLEDDIVATMARLLWRKKNLRTLSTAQYARDRYSKIFNEFVEPDFPPIGDLVDPVRREEQTRAAENQAQKELGQIYELLSAGEATTYDGLERELDIQDRLDSNMTRCLKQLLLVRGVKSISDVSTPRPKRITGPSKAA